MVNITSNPAAAANAYGTTAKIGSVTESEAAETKGALGNFLEDVLFRNLYLKKGEQRSAAGSDGNNGSFGNYPSRDRSPFDIRHCFSPPRFRRRCHNKIQGMPI